jgi:hypothetical protein
MIWTLWYTSTYTDHPDAPPTTGYQPPPTHYGYHHQSRPHHQYQLPSTTATSSWKKPVKTEGKLGREIFKGIEHREKIIKKIKKSKTNNQQKILQATQ